MPDLVLECLIQIKGLAGTPRRLAARLQARGGGADDPDAIDVVVKLALAEARFGEILTLLLSTDCPPLPSIEPPAEPAPGAVEPGRSLEDWQRDFVERRGDTVRVLEACSVRDLVRVGTERSRGRMTVSDLVATMLAHDTDQIGRLL